MRTAALALVVGLLATVAAARTVVDDWALTRQPAGSPGAGQCAVSVKDGAGAVLSLWMRDAAGRKSGFRLTLTLAPALRDLLPIPDGPAALAFRPAGQPATLLEGTLAPDGPLYSFTHTFADFESQRGFLAAGTARLTVFHPEAGVLARFATQGASRAMDSLASCNFTVKAAPDE